MTLRVVHIRQRKRHLWTLCGLFRPRRPPVTAVEAYQAAFEGKGRVCETCELKLPTSGYVRVKQKVKP